VVVALDPAREGDAGALWQQRLGLRPALGGEEVAAVDHRRGQRPPVDQRAAARPPSLAGVPVVEFGGGLAQTADRPLGDGLFSDAFTSDSQLVTSGAQLLLSEEFKFQIKNENSD
jgi:hypothetical protein